jgi:hypothetical protein
MVALPGHAALRNGTHDPVSFLNLFTGLDKFTAQSKMKGELLFS